MSFIEKQKKGDKTYSYLTKTIRLDGTFKKIRVLLSNKEISNAELNKFAKLKENELVKKIERFSKSKFYIDEKLADKWIFHHKYLVWERPCRLFLVYAAAEGLDYPLIKIFGKSWGKTHGVFRNEMVRFVWDMKTFIKNGINITNNMLDKDYFNKKMILDEKLEENLINGYDKLDKIDMKTLSDKRLNEQFLRFHNALYDWWGFSQVSELISYASEFALKKKITDNNFSKITFPTKKSYTTLEEESLYRIASAIKRNKTAYKLFCKDINAICDEINKIPDIKNKIMSHQRKYYWKQNNYHDAKVLSQKYFIKEIKEIIDKNIDIAKIIRNNENRILKIKKEKAEIIKKLELSELDRQLIRFIDFFANYQDKRKAISLKANSYLELFIIELARRTGINKNLLHWSTPYEYYDILRSNFDINQLRDRKSRMTLILDNGKTKLLTGRDSVNAEKKIIGKKQDTNISEFEGMRSQGGKVTGKVVKILDPRRSSHFKTGDILVTTMTSPDFVILMKKASAIITDEGGLTSHAAVVSRELGVPCVIATKIATEVLNDGDLVEVNANHGLVKIIKKGKK